MTTAELKRMAEYAILALAMKHEVASCSQHAGKWKKGLKKRADAYRAVHRQFLKIRGRL